MYRQQSKGSQDLLNERIERLQKHRGFKTLGLRLFLTALITYLLFGVVLGIALVKGDSMIPSLRQNDIVLFFRLRGEYRAGDIVLVKPNDDMNDDHIKRIVGLPGQRIDMGMEGGSLLVDEEVLSEPYIYDKTYSKATLEYPLTLGEDEYFLLGDHRENSLDSRNYGPVKGEQIDGVMLAFLRISG